MPTDSMRDWRETPRRIWVNGQESLPDLDPLKLCLLGVEFRRKENLLFRNSHLSLELEGHLEGPKLLLHRPSRELGVLRLGNCLVANLRVVMREVVLHLVAGKSTGRQGRDRAALRIANCPVDPGVIELMTLLLGTVWKILLRGDMWTILRLWRL